MREMILLATVLGLGVLPACGDSGGSTPQDAAVDVANDAGVDAPAEDAPTVDAPVADAPAATDATGDATQDRPCTLGGTECDAGERCVPAGADDALVCRPAGDAAVGAPCGADGVDDCVAGAACVAYTDTESFCEVLCGDGLPCAETYQVCLPWFGPDGATAGVCLGDVCTPPAEGCAAGERCTVLNGPDSSFYACVPAGEVPPGGDCSVDECAPGAICVGSEGAYVCRSFCHSGSDCGADDQHCIWPWPSRPEIGRCHQGCDPVRGTGCSQGEACYYMDPEIGTTDCWTEGSLAPGADCSSVTTLCQGGYDCILEPGSDPYEYYCRAYCDDEHACATGTCQTTPATPALRFCMP